MKLKTLENHIQYEQYFSLLKKKFPRLKKNSVTYNIMYQISQHDQIQWLDLQRLVWPKLNEREYSSYGYGLDLRHKCEFMLSKQRVGHNVCFSLNEIGKAFLYYVEVLENQRKEMSNEK